MHLSAHFFYSGFPSVHRVIFHCYSVLSMCFGGAHSNISHFMKNDFIVNLNYKFTLYASWFEAKSRKDCLITVQVLALQIFQYLGSLMDHAP